MQFNSSGDTVSSQSGVNTFALTSLGSAVVDPLFWKGFNWNNLTNHVIEANNLGLDDTTSADFSVSETTGIENYSLSLTNGLTVITGVGTRPLPEMLQGGTQNYAYTRTSAFSFANHGLNSFSLTETGSRGADYLALDSVVYSESADRLANVLTGYTFQFTDAGTVVKAGTGNDVQAQTGGQNGLTSVETTTRYYAFSDLQTFSYSENGSAIRFDFSQSGSFTEGHFGFDSVVFTSEGTGSYALNLQKNESSVGSFTTTRTEAGSQSGNLFHALSSAQSGSYTSASAVARAEAGNGVFSIGDEGSYGTGAFSFGQVGLTVFRRKLQLH